MLNYSGTLGYTSLKTTLDCTCFCTKLHEIRANLLFMQITTYVYKKTGIYFMFYILIVLYSPQSSTQSHVDSDD